MAKATHATWLEFSWWRHYWIKDIINSWYPKDPQKMAEFYVGFVDPWVIPCSANCRMGTGLMGFLLTAAMQLSVISRDTSPQFCLADPCTTFGYAPAPLVLEDMKVTKFLPLLFLVCLSAQASILEFSGNSASQLSKSGVSIPLYSELKARTLLIRSGVSGSENRLIAVLSP